LAVSAGLILSMSSAAKKNNFLKRAVSCFQS
jgi:hypothetical protein